MRASENRSKASRRFAACRLRTGIAAALALALAAIGFAAFPHATGSEASTAQPGGLSAASAAASEAASTEAPAEAASDMRTPGRPGDFTISDGMLAQAASPGPNGGGASGSPADGDGPEDEAPGYEIVTDDGIAAEHQAGYVIARIADGATLDEVNAAVANAACLAGQAVSADDAAMGWVKLQLADGVGVPEAQGALAAVAALQETQPNYVYRLDEQGAGTATQAEAQPEAGAKATAGPSSTYLRPDLILWHGQEYSTLDYHTFVDDPQACNQMTLLTTRSREAYQYTHDAEHNPIAWKEDDGHKRPAIAIVDTGCDVFHEDLEGNVIGYYDAVARKEQAGYIQSHGTHVAGIAAAKTNNGKGIAGVSFDAKIVSVKVFKQANGQLFADSIDILAGYEYVIDHAAEDNIRVANMSLGASTATTDGDDKALADAIDRAYEAGILTVISAGNDADSEQGAYCDYPNDFAPHAIGVIDCSVSGIQDNFYDPEDVSHLLKMKLWLTRESYSNYNMANTMNKQLSALGDSVMSTVPLGYGDNDGTQKLYGRKNGTSMAAPCVAGVAALALSVNPDLSVDELKSVLYSSAVDIGDPSEHPDDGRGFDPTTEGFDRYTGFGTVDSYEAVIAADARAFISGPTLVAKGGTVELSIPDASGATDIVWASSDPATVEVQAFGGLGLAGGAGESRRATVRAVGGGQAVVTATCTMPAAPSAHGQPVADGQTRQVTLSTIVSAYEASITGAASVQYGQTVALGLDATPANGTWEWSSDSPGVEVGKWVDEDTGAASLRGARVGTQATVTATLTSDRDITVSKTVSVVRADLSRASLTPSQASFTYDGKAKAPGVTVSLDGATLRNGSDYAVSYKNNVNVGTATVTVTGKGNYIGAKSASFRILAPPAAKKSASANSAKKPALPSGISIARGIATVSKKKLTASDVQSAIAAGATSFVLSSKVKGIASRAFAGTRVKRIVVKTSKLSKKSVKSSLKGSSVNTVKVQVKALKATKSTKGLKGRALKAAKRENAKIRAYNAKARNTNRKYANRYKTYFTKKNCGKRVSVGS